MTYQFCCPQGHLLQGDLSTVGQIMQCPMCGSEFLVPPPDAGMPMSEVFLQGPPTWPAKNAPGGYMPPPNQGFGMPGPMQPMQQTPMMPGGPFAPPGFPPPQFGTIGESAVQPPAPAPKQPPASPSAGGDDRPKFELGFDPFAKAALPFDLPGHSEADAGDNAPASSPASSAFLAGPSQIALPPTGNFPPMPMSGRTPAQFPVPEINPTVAVPSAARSDFLSGPALTDNALASDAPPEEESPPKMLHIRCPSGHMVNAPSNLLGKLGRCPACKKTFELRYENSVEFKRRTEKILNRDAGEAGKAWLGWVFVGGFLVIVALLGLVFILGR